jgi:hypothetical protein
LCIKLRAEWLEDKEIVGRFLPRRGYRTQPRVSTRVSTLGTAISETP